MRTCSYVIIIWILLSCISSFAQSNYESNLILRCENKLIITTDENRERGKLSSGENIQIGSDHGVSYFKIEYKDRNLTISLAESFYRIRIYEVDFGNDGEQELLVVFDKDLENEKWEVLGRTTIMQVYRYSGGLIKKIFEYEITMNFTIVSSGYIELNIPSGLEQQWHYYKGSFYDMNLFLKEEWN